MGGFGGKFFSDSWEINVRTNVLSLTKNQIGAELFPFAMPALCDFDNKVSYTVCWKTMKMYSFSKGSWSVEAANLRYK